MDVGRSGWRRGPAVEGVCVGSPGRNGDGAGASSREGALVGRQIASTAAWLFESRSGQAAEAAVEEEGDVVGGNAVGSSVAGRSWLASSPLAARRLTSPRR